MHCIVKFKIKIYNTIIIIQYHVFLLKPLCFLFFRHLSLGIMLKQCTQARIQDFEMGGEFLKCWGGVNFCNNVIEPKPG